MVPLVSTQQQYHNVFEHCDRFCTSIKGSDNTPSPCCRQESVLAENSFAQKKRVHFSSKQEQYHSIISLDDYTDKELDDCWVTEQERARRIKSSEKAAKRMGSGKKPTENNTYRGLEGFLQGDSIDDTVHNCIDAVMDEQERQWDESATLIDWDRYRAVSLEVSSQSVSFALRMAEFDAAEAREAYINTEDDNSVESDEFSQASEIPQSLKEQANGKLFLHPRKLRSIMRTSS